MKTIITTKSEALYSKEGVGQGDPLSMLMYASALMPLNKSLSNPTTWWYADDSSCTAKLTDLCVWFDKLCDLGPKYGYHPKPEKCILIVDADHEARAKSMFQHLGIKVVNGYSFLGGDRESTKQFLDNKITGWVNNHPKLQSHNLKQLLLHYPNPCRLSGPTILPSCE